jgi:hypothetical protein
VNKTNVPPPSSHHVHSLDSLGSGQKKHSVAIEGLRKEIKAEVKAREALGEETSASFVTVDERLDGDTKRLDKMEARLDRMQDELRIGADQVGVPRLITSHDTPLLARHPPPHAAII